MSFGLETFALRSIASLQKVTAITSDIRSKIREIRQLCEQPITTVPGMPSNLCETRPIHQSSEFNSSKTESKTLSGWDMELDLT
jgi:hypothetical protein